MLALFGGESSGVSGAVGGTGGVGESVCGGDAGGRRKRRDRMTRRGIGRSWG